MGYGLIGAGKIKVAPYNDAVPFGKRIFRDLLNSDKFSYSFEEDKQVMADHRSPAGGNYDAYSRISGVKLDMGLLELTPANIALALWGSTSALTATAITGEAHIITAGAFVPTERIINTTVAPVVKKGATVIAPADYTVSAGGITIAATITTATVVSGDAITIDYTPLVGADVQTLIGSAPEVSLFFEGYNRNTGKYRTARIYRCKLGVASGVENIGTTYVPLGLTAEVIKDESITGAGLSQFFALEEPLAA